MYFCTNAGVTEIFIFTEYQAKSKNLRSSFSAGSNLTLTHGVRLKGLLIEDLPHDLYSNKATLSRLRNLNTLKTKMGQAASMLTHTNSREFSESESIKQRPYSIFVIAIQQGPPK